MEGYLAEIRGFAGNFAPRAWAFCNGQLMSIAQNQALFSLLGTTYGGDGRTTFALPDLRGRAPISAGQGPGLSDHRLGSRSGTETVTLNILEMPIHNHQSSMSGAQAVPEYNTDAAANETPALGDVPAASNYGSGITTQQVKSYGAPNNLVPGQPLPITGSVTIGMTGGSQPHNNMQPYLTIYWIICMQGIFPSRN